MFILTSLTLPFAARTAFSSIGVSWRQGPHQGAQKSISTGWRFDSSMTSFTNVWVVVSLIRSDAACGAGPLPCSTIVTRSSANVLAGCLAGWAGSSTTPALIGGCKANLQSAEPGLPAFGLIYAD